MKRVVGLILVLMLICSSALCEGIDFSSMTNDELVDLIESAREECRSRGIIRSGNLSVGTYVVGKDVAAASYDICTTESESYTNYYIFSSAEDYELFMDLSSRTPLIVDRSMARYEEHSKIDLIDGQILVIEHNSLHLEEISNNLMP